jgi:hypothetical protein
VAAHPVRHPVGHTIDYFKYNKINNLLIYSNLKSILLLERDVPFIATMPCHVQA